MIIFMLISFGEVRSKVVLFATMLRCLKAQEQLRTLGKVLEWKRDVSFCQDER